MRTMAIVRRVFKQMLRDKRTLALMFLAPLLIMALMYFLFQNNTTQVATLGVHNVDHQVVKAINTKHVDIHHYSSNQAKAMIKQHDLDGYLTQKDGNLTITYSNSNPTNTSLIKASLQSGLVKLKIQTLVTATKAQKKVLQTQQVALQKLTAAQKQATVSKLKTALAQAQASGNTAAAAKIQKQLRQLQRVLRRQQIVNHKRRPIPLAVIIFMVVVIQRSLKTFCQSFSVSLSSSLCS